MKKFVVIIVLVALLFIYRECGNALFVETIPVDSELYTQQEINKAINSIKQYFTFHFEGCTLKEISYAGDEQSLAYRDSTHDVIVLTSTFTVNASDGDGSLNPNSTYTSWKWILIKDENGKWKHVDHGYG